MESTPTASPVDKDYFYTQLNEFYSGQKNKLKKPWSSQRHSEVIQIIIDSKQAIQSKIKRTNEHYYFGNHYDVIELNGIKKVIKKRKNKNDPIIFLVPYEEIYDKLVDFHQSTGHGGRDKMKLALSKKFYIHRTCIEIFLKCCKQCTEKRSQPRKGLVVRHILSTDWNHRGQIDLIDFQSTPDGEYKWLLSYEDNLTKFIHLRPLKTTHVEEVSLELLKIFLEFGAPQILQSDNDREFVDAIIKDLVSKWPECKIINGLSQHPQGSDERSDQDVEVMLRSWIKDNNSQNWSLGCYYVQWQKNSSYHTLLGYSPYKALFGVDFKAGLNSTNLSSESITAVPTLEMLYDTLPSKMELEETDDEFEDINNSLEVVTGDETIEKEQYYSENIKTEPLDIIIDVPILTDDVFSLTKEEKNKNSATCSICLTDPDEKCSLCSCAEKVQGQKRSSSEMISNTNKKLKLKVKTKEKTKLD